MRDARADAAAAAERAAAAEGRAGRCGASATAAAAGERGGAAEGGGTVRAAEGGVADQEEEPTYEELKYQHYDASNRLARCTALLERVAREKAVAEERSRAAEGRVAEVEEAAARAGEQVGVAEAAVVAATERAVAAEEKAGVAEGRVAEVEEKAAREAAARSTALEAKVLEAGAREADASTKVGGGQEEEPTYEVLPPSTGPRPYCRSVWLRACPTTDRDPKEVPSMLSAPCNLRPGHPTLEAMGKSEINLPHMPPDSGGMCMGVD